MATLTLPRRYQGGIAEIISWSDESANALITALESAPVTLDYTALAKKIAEKTGTSPAKVRDVLRAIVSLHYIRSSKVSLTEFVDDVEDAVRESPIREVLEKTDPKRFKDRLLKLLTVRTLVVAAKSQQVQKEYQNTLCSAEMFSDIRPILDSEGTSGATVLAAMFTHTMKITYHHGEDIRELFLTLDADDLDTIESLIEAARNNARQMQSIVDAAGLPNPESE